MIILQLENCQGSFWHFVQCLPIHMFFNWKTGPTMEK